MTFGNTAPVFTSGSGATASYTIQEHSTLVATLTASDPDGDDAIFSIRTGAVYGIDGGLFQINPFTGALGFVSAPNYEIPDDDNADNEYLVTVEISDGKGGITTQRVSMIGRFTVSPFGNVGLSVGTDSVSLRHVVLREMAGTGILEVVEYSGRLVWCRNQQYPILTLGMYEAYANSNSTVGHGVGINDAGQMGLTHRPWRYPSCAEGLRLICSRLRPAWPL